MTPRPAPGHALVSSLVLLVLLALFAAAPSSAQVTRFAPEDVRSGDFGYPLALSADGATVLIGDVQDDVDGTNNQGSAYVFAQQSDGTYAQVQKLVASQTAEEPFGEYVALSDDAEVAFVRLETEINFRDRGIIYIYTRNGDGTYSESQQITSTERQNLGEALATSGTGNILVAGAPGYSISGTNAVGAAYVYERQADGSYVEIQRVEASDANTRGTFGDFFGYSTALSADGETLLVGAVNDGFGSVYVFDRGSDGRYTETSKIEVSDRPNDYQFGSPLALSADAGTILIGTDEGQGSPPGPRKAFVYVRAADGTYTQQQVFEPNGAQSSRDGFGMAVAASSNGQRLLAGAPLFNEAYYYERMSDGTYALENTLDDGGLDPGLVRFGRAVALRNDGTLALVGVPGSEPTADGTPRGSVYTFTGTDLPVELTQFDADLDGDAVQLVWQTATETNNAGFAIERAVGTGSFADVAFVDGAGTTAEPQRYTFRDAGLPFNATRIRYRLRQTDTDGTTALSTVVPVARRADALSLQALFPNPTSGTATIQYVLPTAADVQIDVFDLLGRRVASLAAGREAAGRVERTLDVRALAAGTYLIRLQAGARSQSQRLIVLR